MKNDRIVLITLVVALVLGGAFWFMGREKPTRFKWNRALRLDRQEPYDLSVFYNTLKSEYTGRFSEIQGHSALKDEIHAFSPQMGDIYVYAGEKLNLTREECSLLAGFISSGGTAFVSASALPDALLKQFPVLQTAYVKSLFLDTFRTRFRHPSVKPAEYVFPHYSGREVSPAEWYVLSNDMNGAGDMDSLYADMEATTESLVIVSSSKGQGADMIIVHHDAGQLILHLNPAMLANVYLSKPSGRQYLAAVFGHLPAGRVIFDLSARLPKQDASPREPRSNMLDFVRSQPTLRYAWWLLLGSVALFLIFGGRRRQRSIPVIQPPVNHTMAFVDAIGRFYHSERQNALVFRREWNQLMVFIRQHFRISTMGTSDEDVRRLADRSGVSEETIRHILRMYEKYRIFSELKPDELTEINQAIGRFYQEYQLKYGKSKSGKRTAQPA